MVGMIEGSKVCLDVDYRAERVVAACVGFTDWSDAEAAFEFTRDTEGAPSPYESGQFYRREMPYLLKLLGELEPAVGLIIIDGFVWLDGQRPGLGAHLSHALGGACPVIGVAKRPFVGAANAVPLLRGASHVPLFVSAIGIELDIAVRGVAQMHGEHRVPTLLSRVDRLSRA
jgi:deoxyribonuclease V